MSFIKSTDICLHDHNVDRGSLINHLKIKTDQKYILHELVLVFLNSYSFHFKSNKNNSNYNSNFHYEYDRPALDRGTINPAYIFGARDIVPHSLTAGTRTTARMSTSPSPSPPTESPIPSVIHPPKPPPYELNSTKIRSKKERRQNP